MYILIKACLGLYSGKKINNNKAYLLANKMLCVLKRPFLYSQNTKNEGEETKLNLKRPH